MAKPYKLVVGVEGDKALHELFLFMADRHPNVYFFDSKGLSRREVKARVALLMRIKELESHHHK